MTTKTLKIHTENILPIIKKWLYSDKEVFVRELVSNACDAIQKCKTLAIHGQLAPEEDSFRIDITLNKEAKTLTFADNGIGMTAEEVEKYIAQIAFSGAEEFLNTYKSQEQIIGHFGLGFFSAYMVATRVTIDTLSYQEGASPAFWSCEGTTTYEMALGERKKRGTTITLYLDKESEEFLEETRIRHILTQYCAFLPIPIYLNNVKINKEAPLWLKNASTCTKQDYLQFYHTLHPFDEDPIFWIHLNIDYPFHVKGILYFPKVSERFNFQDKLLRLFCNRVFVSDNCKDLLPDYLAILRGAIDSPDIPLNVSRSALQLDRTVRSLAQHIAKKVCGRLGSLYTKEKEYFLSIWPDIEPIIKLGILQDEKFAERALSFLLWKNEKGEWTTIEEYLERHKEGYKGKIYYSAQQTGSTPVLNLYLEKGIEVLQAGALLDPPLFNVLEQKYTGISFHRIDSALDPQLLDPSREKSLLDSDGKSEAAKIAAFIRSHLNVKDLEIEAQSLANNDLPACIVINENTRRMRDTLHLTQHSVQPHEFPTKQTFIVNTNHKLVQSLPGLATTNPSLAKDLVWHLYDLSLLSQKELPPSRLATFSSRAYNILQQVTDSLLHKS